MRRQGGLFLCMLCLNHDNQHQDVDDQGCSRNNRAEQFHALTPFGNPSGEEIFTPVGRTCAVRGATAFEKMCGCVIAGLSPCDYYSRFCAECQFRSKKISQKNRPTSLQTAPDVLYYTGQFVPFFGFRAKPRTGNCTCLLLKLWNIF